jgi:hypothetical protein
MRGPGFSQTSTVGLSTPLRLNGPWFDASCELGLNTKTGQVMEAARGTMPSRLSCRRVPAGTVVSARGKCTGQQSYKRYSWEHLKLVNSTD